MGTWLHVPTGLRRGDGRSETVFVASGRDCVFSLPPPASGSEEEGGRAFGNRFRCLLQGLCIFAPPSMDLERRGDGRSETVFAASAGKLPDPTSPHLIWRGGKRSKTFFVVSDRQGIKSSSHGPRNRRGGRHSETVCIVVSKTLGGVQRPSLDFFVFLRSFHDLPAILYDHTCCCEGTRKRKILFQACVNDSRDSIMHGVIAALASVLLVT